MSNENSGSGLSSSLTDLMASLAVIFILLFVAQLNYYGKKGELTRGVILAHLQKQLEEFSRPGDNAIRVLMDPKDPLSVLIIVPEGLLNFAVDKADISSVGKQFLGAFIPRLADAICEHEIIRDDISLIVVEGHADSTGTETRNLPLSQERSMKVAMEGLGLLLDKPNHGCFRDLLSASGRGSAQPILTEPIAGYAAHSNLALVNQDELVRRLSELAVEDKDRSRRVVFKIRVRSLEQQHLIGATEGADGKQ